MTRKARLATFTLALAACEPSATTSPTEAATSTDGTQAEASAATSDEEAWDCEGVLPPPRYFAQETRFAANGDRARAVSLAQQKLLERICDPEMDCSGLREKVSTWKTGISPSGEACSMAVIDRRELEAWTAKHQSPAGLDADTDAAVDALFKGKTPKTVALGGIQVAQLLGSEVGDWVATFMHRSLARRGVAVRELPAGFDGINLPEGVDAVLQGRVFRRKEGAADTLELHWVAQLTADGTLTRVPADPIQVRAQIVPGADQIDATAEGPERPPVWIQVSNPSGLDFCPGQSFEAHLNASRPTYVRVYSLWGEARGIRVFPAEGDGLVQPGTPVSLAGGPGQSLQAIGKDGSQELWAVLYADDPSAFGSFEAGIASDCQVDPGMSSKLQSGDGLPPGVQHSLLGYEIRSRPGCRTYMDATKIERTLSQLEAMPTCGG